MANIVVTESATADRRYQSIGVLGWSALDELDQEIRRVIHEAVEDLKNSTSLSRATIDHNSEPLHHPQFVDAITGSNIWRECVVVGGWRPGIGSHAPKLLSLIAIFSSERVLKAIWCAFTRPLRAFRVVWKKSTCPLLSRSSFVSLGL